MSLDNIKRRNNIIFLFGRYLKIVEKLIARDGVVSGIQRDNGLAGEYSTYGKHEYLKSLCDYNLSNYDKIFARFGYFSFYKDLGFIQGVLHSDGHIDINEDEELFQKLFDSIANQSPENLY